MVNVNLEVILFNSVLNPLYEILVSCVDPTPNKVLKKLFDVECEGRAAMKLAWACAISIHGLPGQSIGMDAADFHELLVQVETVLDRKLLALLLRELHDLGHQISCIRGI